MIDRLDSLTIGRVEMVEKINEIVDQVNATTEILDMWNAALQPQAVVTPAPMTPADEIAAQTNTRQYGAMLVGSDYIGAVEYEAEQMATRNAIVPQTGSQAPI